MKRVVTLLISILIVLTLTACGSSSDNNSNKLKGTWVAEEDDLVFEIDSKTMILRSGNDSIDLSYEIKGDKLVATSEEYDNTVEFDYRLEGENLIIVIDDEEVVFKKYKEEQDTSVQDETAKAEEIEEAEDTFTYLQLDKDLLKYREVTIDSNYFKDGFIDRWGNPLGLDVDVEEAVNGIEIYGIYGQMVNDKYDFEKGTINSAEKTLVFCFPDEIDGKKVISVIYDKDSYDRYAHYFIYGYKLPKYAMFAGYFGDWRQEESNIFANENLKYVIDCTIVNGYPKQLCFARNTQFLNVDEDEIRFNGISNNIFLEGFANEVVIEKLDEHSELIINTNGEIDDIKNVTIKSGSIIPYGSDISSTNLVVEDDVVGSLLTFKVRNLYLGANNRFEADVHKDFIETIHISDDSPFIFGSDLNANVKIYNSSGKEINWNNVFLNDRGNSYDNENATFVTGRFDFGNFYIDIVEE